MREFDFKGAQYGGQLRDHLDGGFHDFGTDTISWDGGDTV
jgi:hypothetical protein